MPRRVRPARGTAAAGTAVAVGLLVAGCSVPAPPVATALRVTAVTYDCGARTLTVVGDSAPASPGLEVQVQARTPVEHLTPVWANGESDAAGAFRVTARYVPASVRGGTVVTVRAGAVKQGIRIFSPRVTQQVTCR